VNLPILRLVDYIPTALENPSLQDAVSFLASTTNGAMRAIRNPDSGTLWIWDANDATHNQVVEVLELDWDKIVKAGSH